MLFKLLVKMSKINRKDSDEPPITIRLENVDSLPALSPEDAAITRKAAEVFGGTQNKPVAFDIVKGPTTKEAENSLVREMIKRHEARDGDTELHPYSPETPLGLDGIKQRAERANVLSGSAIARACRRFLREVDQRKH